jgi:putative transcriptional regulator
MLDDVMAGRPATKPAPPFGQKLAALRKERGLTQAQLAALLGVSLEMVDYYERRAKNPSTETLKRVGDALNVDPAYFLGEKRAERKKPGPPSMFEERIKEARRLPRRKQEQLVRMIDAFLDAERRSA